MSRLIRAFRARLDRALSAAIGAGLLAIFLLNMYQVGGRYLFAVGEVWIPDVTRFLFIWMVFLGTALMHLRRGHLVIDFVQVRLPMGLRRATEALINGSMLAMAGILLVVGWRIMQIRMDIPYTGWEVPTRYAYAAVPVAAILIGLTSLANLYEWRQGQDLREADGGAV
ncbi:MAG TPA: TRAP transporter small permease [Candidatus Acidoferrum sp.]|nr:TRAP transporter small permease [Candidatus Acidoferrum sp.]